MFYPKLVFPTKKHRPFFYTNFVATLDGKVAVNKPGYWPIGSKKDYEVLVELRAYADCLIHGGNLGREFGQITIENINRPSFRTLRKRLGKDPELPYYVVTKRTGVNLDHPEGGIAWHPLSRNLAPLINHLKKQGYKHVLVEGGPTLLGSFLKENLIDEIFLTIAPKIYGTEKNATKNLVEGILFPPDDIKKLKLLSVKKIKDELFLRYRVLS